MTFELRPPGTPGPGNPPELTDEQRTRFVAIVKKDRKIGNAAALRQAGVEGSRRDLRALLEQDDDLHEEARAARGWNIVDVEASAWKVAADPEHPAWDRANARILKAYNARFRDQATVDHEHSGRVEVTVEHDYTQILDKLEQYGVVRRGLDEDADPPPRKALPARTD